MAETRIIKVGDQDWKVTPFHCVVGPIVEMDANFPAEFSGEKMLHRLWPLYEVWHASSRVHGTPSWAGILGPAYLQGFVYPLEWKAVVQKWRQPNEFRPAGCWVLNYTNNPLIVNEYQWGEITLACIDEGRLQLVNFSDLPGAEDAKKIYFPGEFWLNYAEGGAERALRTGGVRGGE